MSKYGFDVDQLDRWERWLGKLKAGDVARMNDRILRTAGLRTLEYVHDLTPRRSGRLQNSMIFGQPDNVFDLQVGSTSYVFVGTAVPYAQNVNDGFSQEKRKGKFVPGEWKSGTFHYMPGAKTGMVLKGKVIPGAHMFDKAMDYLEDDLPTIVEFEFKRLFDELLK